MKRPASLHIALAAATLAFTLPAAHAQKSDIPAVAQHIAAATAAAKNDELGPLGLCNTATPANGPDFMANYNEMSKRPPLAPMKVMDDLYFRQLLDQRVGNQDVGRPHRHRRAG
jgi:hypothetical protein